MEEKKEKGKSISVSSPVFSEESDNKQQFPSVRFSSRNASSKYDFIKVKVWLGDNADHYYVLSRFLLCRMLTVTKVTLLFYQARIPDTSTWIKCITNNSLLFFQIPNHVAIKIALELKKLLIDNSLLDVYAIPIIFLRCDAGFKYYLSLCFYAATLSPTWKPTYLSLWSSEDMDKST